MSLKLYDNLKELRIKAKYFEKTNINNEIDISDRTICAIKIAKITFSLLIFIILRNGFSAEFVSFVSTILSIIIGLFITALIFSFDKFYEVKINEISNSKDKIWDLHSFNFTKKFAYVTGYTIILCVATIFLLSYSALFRSASETNVFKLNFCFNCIGIDNLLPIKLFLISFLAIVQRIFVIYSLLKILYYTLFIVSSMVKFMNVKLNKK